MANTATITDTLPEIIESAWDRIVEALKKHYEMYPADGCPDWSDLDRDGTLHEIVDGAVPIYNRKLDALAYFHLRDALAALEDQFGETYNGDWPLGTFAAGLYCLIDEACRQMFDDEAEDLWQEWQESKDL